MLQIGYKLRYLPQFYQDLEEKLLYIAFDLQNPQATNDLLGAVEDAILKRQPHAEAAVSPKEISNTCASPMTIPPMQMAKAILSAPGV